MAQLDGELIAAPGYCCDGLQLEVKVGSVNARHDDDCDALNPGSPGSVSARLNANVAAASVLHQRGVGPIRVVVSRR